MDKGLFITFEGSEGCGKSTQIQRLAGRLAAASAEVVETREPGGTKLGEAVRHLLKFAPEGQGMTPESELLLFEASRAQLVREVVQPALARGAVVLSDRFFDSTTVYQGLARRIEPEIVAMMNRFAVGDCIPDLTLVLDLDPEIARARMLRRPRAVGAPDRMEQEPMEFYSRVRQGYLDLAAAEPGRIVVVDAADPAGEVEAKIWTILKERFHGVFERDSI